MGKTNKQLKNTNEVTIKTIDITGKAPVKTYPGNMTINELLAALETRYNPDGNVQLKLIFAGKELKASEQKILEYFQSNDIALHVIGKPAATDEAEATTASANTTVPATTTTEDIRDSVSAAVRRAELWAMNQKQRHVDNDNAGVVEMREMGLESKM